MTKTLIVAHADHPLVNGEFPNAAFGSRLDAAAIRLTELVFEKHEAEIFVPGSRHHMGGVNDRKSLSDAGVAYLMGKHLLESDLLHGTEWMDTYAGTSGVYHSADEVMVASQGFQTGKFDNLVAVSSPGRIRRLRTHYRAYGIKPEFVSATAGAGRSPGGIAAEWLLTTYTYFDPRWQKGSLSQKIRKSRQPTDKLGIRSIA